MKVGFVLDDSLDRTDGAQQYVLTLGAWLSRQGHEVHYLVGETKRQDINNTHSLAKNLRVRFNSNRLTIPLPARRTRIAKTLKWLKLDVLHVQMPYSPLMAGVILSKTTDETLVGTFHILPSTQMARIGTKILGTLQNQRIKNFDRLFAPSNPASAFAAEYYGADCEVLPNPVEISRFKKLEKRITRKNSKTRIVFLGRLVERKGCLHLLKAVSVLLKRHRLEHTEVIIGGKGPLLPQLEKFVKSSGLSAVVKFEGFIQENKKAEFLGGADLAVFPSTGGESFGIILIEAMASGAGVVLGGDNEGYLSVLGSWPECIFDPTDANEFADKLDRLISDNKVCQRLHMYQQDAVRQYDVEVVGQRLLSSYQSLIAKKR